MTTYNNNCVGCGCGPAIPEPCITPPPVCLDPQPCTEIINAECVMYTGPAITCNFSPVIPANSSIAEALDSIVEYLCFGRCCVIPIKNTIDLPDHIVLCTDETEQCDYEGKLYNWYALNAGTQGDGRVAGGIVNIDPLVNLTNTWRVPNNNDWYSLILALDPTATIPSWANVAGGDLKTTTCWSKPNTGATDSSGLSIQPGVKRLFTTGLFTTNNGQEAWYWSTGITGNTSIYEFVLYYNTALVGYLNSGNLLQKKDGVRVRLVRPVNCNSSEKDGDFIPNAYIDNTGTRYNGKVIGTLVWLTTDLTDVTYNNGSSIPNIVFDAPWIAATTGAWCYPNNNAAFKIIYSIGCVERKITFDDFLNFLPTSSQTFMVTAAAGIQVNSSTTGSQTTYQIINTDPGSAQNIFKNIAVAGQSTIIADTNSDTLTVVAGTGIALTTNALTDTLTITNTIPTDVTLSDAGTYTHESLVNDGTGPTLATKGLKAGTGITLSSTATDVTITSNYGIFAQTRDSTPITSGLQVTLVDAGVGTLTIPANGFSMGDSFRATFGGTMSCKNGETLTIRINSNLGVITLSQSPAYTLPIITSQVWLLTIDFTIRSTGVAGLAILAAIANLHVFKAASGTQEGFAWTTINNTTFNTTISNTLDFTAQWGSNSPATNSIYSDIFVLNKTY